MRRIALCSVTLLVAFVPGLVQAAEPPDGRAFELISRDASDGRTVDGVFPQAPVAIDDDRLLWGTYAEALGDGRTGAGRWFLSSRTDRGWRATPLHSPSAPGQNGGVEIAIDATSDVQTTVMEVAPGIIIGPSTFHPGAELRRRTPTGEIQRVASITGQQYRDGEVLAHGALSADGETIVYGSTVDPDGQANGYPQVYRWTAANGAVAVGVDAGGQPLSACGATLARSSGASAPVASVNPNSVSADGETAYVQSPPAGASCPEPTQVYVRRGSTTFRVSGPAAGVADPGRPVTFAGATADGDEAYLVTDGALTADDLDATQDLYRAGIGSDSRTSLECVTCASSKTLYMAQATGNQSVATSPRADHVYLMLEDGGAHGLYVYDGDTIEPVDPDVPGTIGLANTGGFEITPNGTAVAYSRTPSAGDEGTGTQLYVARTSDDAEPLSPQCLSCGSGANASTFVSMTNLGVDTTADPVPRNAYGLAGRRGSISDDGRTVVFGSTNKLLDGAVDGAATNRANAYRWRDGAGLALVASAATSHNAPVLVSPSGRTIFLTADDPLAPESLGTSERQWFAARIGGGFPLVPPPTPCEGEGCRGPQAPVPVDPVVRSSGPAVVGNAAPPATPVPSSLRVAKPTASQRRALARGGQLRLSVVVKGAGPVTVRGTARVRGKTRTVLHGRASAVGAEAKVRPLVRLTSGALRELRTRRRLSVRVSVSLAGARTQRLTLVLVGGRR